MSDFFTPTNPYDTKRTNLEYELWMQEREKKMDDFPYIAISRKERLFLVLLNKDYIKITDRNRQIAFRLRNLELIFIHKNDNPDSDIQEFAVPRYRGVNYLAYIKEQEKQTKFGLFKDVLLTIAGGIVWHPLISKAFEIIKSLFEK